MQSTDAIVNSTNGTLTLETGDSKLIMTKGGFRLRAECIEYVNRQGPLETAEVAVTKGVGLRCLYVIHVSAPIYVNGRRGEPENLRKSLISALEAAESLSCTSISIPAISYAYPKSESTAILVKTARIFLRTHTSQLKSIYFVSTDKSTIRCFEQAKDSLYREECILGSSSSL